LLGALTPIVIHGIVSDHDFLYELLSSFQTATSPRDRLREKAFYHKRNAMSITDLLDQRFMKYNLKRITVKDTS